MYWPEWSITETSFHSNFFFPQLDPVLTTWYSFTSAAPTKPLNIPGQTAPNSCLFFYIWPLQVILQTLHKHLQNMNCVLTTSRLYLNLSQLLESCRSCHLLTTSLCGISDSNHPSYTCYGWSSQDECHLDEVLAIQCNLWDIQVTSFMHGWLIHSSLFPLPNDGRGCDGYPILSTS